jgi:hypothetical protein
MSNQSLSAVALHVVDQYGTAGKTLNQAYRAGVERLVDGAKSRFASALQARSIPLVNDQIKTDLIAAQQVLAGFMLKGVEAAYARADQAIDTISARATSGIQAAANTVARVEAAFEIKSLDTLRALNMPAATLVSQIADKAAEGAKAVEARIATVAEEIATTEVAVVAKPARRAAVRKA